MTPAPPQTPARQMTAPAPILIRDAAEADMPAIQAIYAHHVATGGGSFEYDPPDVAEMIRRRAALVDAGYPYVVAEDAGHILGYAYAGPYRPRRAYRYTVEDSVYVAADVHRRGVGRGLLAELIRRCTEAGYRQMIAVIGDSGNTGSVGLHRKMGFREVGIIRDVGFKFGRWLDSVTMQLPLGDGGDTLPEA
ncbi:MAG: GNAT family N-acetyltransferase [Rhodospirillales bacterium CG15_BIG_FIL_POST_REV_8_21_14_020_66_15]|nr:MAG: GNAT family N-acetyltransferase [Rhodospirillales bacterium CG15_BIG_FIL_POST_REV_8_21_14_020_66_15]